MGLFTKKDINLVLDPNHHSPLKKTMGKKELLMFGIGAIIGTGVFTLTGITAAKFSGPAVIVSFLIAALCCAFIALAYTEIASMMPTSGSIYTYSYVALGEAAAWFVGWMLILEFSFCAITVANGWSSYIEGVLKIGGIHLPDSITNVPYDGGVINILAVLITLFITYILIKGTKESATLNNILVVLKIGAIFIFLVVAAPSIDIKHNWSEFMPFGFGGVAAGAGTILLAFVGFDALATTAEECKDPKNDLVFGIIGSLIVCAIIYMLVSGMLTAIVPYHELNNAEPLAYALRKNGSNIGSALVATGAIAGMTTVLIVLLYAQTRILFVMARDGLMPKFFTIMHKKYHTPHVVSIFTGVLVAIASGFFPVHISAGLANMGTLVAFMFAAIVVMILRKRNPEIERPFVCPYIYVVGLLAILSCGYLLYSLFIDFQTSKMTDIGWMFIIWSLIGIFLYLMFYYKRPRNVS